MRIHALFHAPFEKLGVIKQWADENQHTLTTTHSYRKETVPTKDDFDFLIIMGGPQSACALPDYPYLQKEVELTKQAIADNKVVLGICLGAQIIGHALGAKTEHSPHREVGVYPIELTPEALTDPLFKQFPQQFDVMHWHNDMPGLTKDCVLLAKSAGCPRQAFRYGDRVYGFQFHAEMTKALIEGMITNAHSDLTPGQFVQSRDELLHADFEPINQKMLLTLNYLAQKIG